MPTTVKQYTQDTADRVRLTIGTVADPAPVTGGSVVIRTKRAADGVSTEAAATTITNPDGPVVELARAWQVGELPAAGGSYIVEAVVTYANAEKRTYPGADQPTLVMEVAPRKTS